MTDSKELFIQDRWLNLIEKSFNVRVGKFISKNKYNITFVYKNYLGVKIYGAPLPGTFTNSMKAKIYDTNFNLIKYWSDFVRGKFKVAIIREYDMVDSGLPSNVFKFITYGAKIKYGSYDENLKYLPQKTRNIAKKGFKNNSFSIANSSNIRSLIEKHFQNLIFTFNKRGLNPAHPIEAYFSLVDNLIINEDYILIVTKDKNQNITASALFLISENKLIFHSGGNNALGLKNAAPTAIQVYAQHIAHEKKLDYDFGGMGHKSIDKFKLSFNPDIYKVSNYIIGNKIFIYIIVFLIFRRSFFNVINQK